MGVGGWFDNLFCLRRFVRRREEGVWQSTASIAKILMIVTQSSLGWGLPSIITARRVTSEWEQRTKSEKSVSERQSNIPSLLPASSSTA